MAKRKGPARPRRAKLAKQTKRPGVESRRLKSPNRVSTRASRTLATSERGVKGAFTRQALDRWRHLSPAARKGKTKAAFITRSVASRIGRWRFKLEREVDKPAPRTSAGRQKPRPKPQVEAPPKLVEFHSSVNYSSNRSGHTGMVQASVMAPPETPIEDLRAAILDALAGRTPRFEVGAIEWRRPLSRLRGE